MTLSLPERLRRGTGILANRIDQRVPIERIAEDPVCIANTEAIFAAMREAADELERRAAPATP